MNLASKEFFIFLPVVVLAYHLLPGRGPKYNLLLGASWLFYAWAAPKYLWVLLALTVIDYVVGLRIEATNDDRKRRWWVAVSVVSNLGLLVLFKALTSFAVPTAFAAGPAKGVLSFAPGDVWTHVVLPLGISFHTFQGISYTVDVYRRQIAAVRSFRDYALFVAFFPQLAAGPIVRAVEFLPQMATPPSPTARQLSDGVVLFCLGLFKKLFIADQLDQLFVAPVFADPAAFDAGTHRWAVLAWAVQIYCDFSGYTDIAIGTGKFFGFDLPPNFRLPYLATSITDFWRRWHLSLSTWLRDYLYFPLGGSRGSAARTYFNLTVVFVLCGLWHGAEWKWLAYGLYNGVLMCLHRAIDRAVSGIAWVDELRASVGWKLFAWAGTFWMLLAGLVAVRMESWAGGWLMLQSLAGIEHIPAAALSKPVFVPWVGGAPLAVPVLIALGLAGHLAEVGRLAAGNVRFALPEPARAIAAAAAVALLVTLGPGVGKTFIYIQF